MWKTIGGVMTLAVLRNGLRLLNTPNYVELMVMGAVLILALLLDRVLSSQTEAR
jgi:ribose transport system permease protein